MKPREEGAIRRVCDAYAIVLFEAKRSRAGDVSRGPNGHGIHVRRRELYTDHALSDRRVDFKDVLHEASHIIMQPPGYDIEAVPEDWVLMAFERCLARKVASRKAVGDVIGWQEATTCCLVWPWEELGWHGKLYGNQTEWKQAFARCRRLGVIDAESRPTWSRPNWEGLVEDDWRMLRYWT